MTTFTISAAGSTSEQIQQALEHQRSEPGPTMSLKNLVIDQIQAYLRALPEGSRNFSVSVSGSVGYKVPSPREAPPA